MPSAEMKTELRFPLSLATRFRLVVPTRILSCGSCERDSMLEWETGMENWEVHILTSMEAVRCDSEHSYVTPPTASLESDISVCVERYQTVWKKEEKKQKQACILRTKKRMERWSSSWGCSCSESSAVSGLRTPPPTPALVSK